MKYKPEGLPWVQQIVHVTSVKPVRDFVRFFDWQTFEVAWIPATVRVIQQLEDVFKECNPNQFELNAYDNLL